MKPADLEWARLVAQDPDLHFDGEISKACGILEQKGDLTDWSRAVHLRKALDRPRTDLRQPLAWALVFAVVIGAFAGFAAWSVWQILSLIDIGAALQFIAPTAFETRSIEALAEGVRP